MVNKKTRQDILVNKERGEYTMVNKKRSRNDPGANDEYDIVEWTVRETEFVESAFEGIFASRKLSIRVGKAFLKMNLLTDELNARQSVKWFIAVQWIYRKNYTHVKESGYQSPEKYINLITIRNIHVSRGEHALDNGKDVNIKDYGN